MRGTTRFLSGLIATTIMASAAMLVAVADTALPGAAGAADVPAQARIVSDDGHGHPILLARMVVTATPLPR